MKKLVQINVVCTGSTGKIMQSIHKEALKKGYESYCFFGRGKGDKNCYKICNKFSIYIHVILARIGFNGCGSYFTTKKFIRKLRNINPDIIQLHNIHGYYLNIKLLFNYLKKEYSGKVIWTLHDCWSFTGHCSYFSAIKCNKWQKVCFDCQQLKTYPKTLIDRSKKEFLLKKSLFSNIPNLTITVPSFWLQNLVKKSFLKNYPIKVVFNGIDMNIFKSNYDKSIYSIYNIPLDKKIILGVANIWESRKGLDVFLKLSNIINSNMIIVLVGLNDKQIKNLPKNIIGIKKTENINHLVGLYSLADVFVNPSLEETFSLVTVEAMACETPVVVCNTSAIKDLVEDNTGYIVKNNNAKEYYKLIKIVIKNGKKYYRKDLINNVKKYSNNLMSQHFLDLYEEN